MLTAIALGGVAVVVVLIVWARHGFDNEHTVEPHESADDE